MSYQGVLSGSDLLSVKPDVSQAIYSLEIKNKLLIFSYFRSSERLAVHPLAKLVFPKVIDVVADLRILDHPGSQKIQLHVAWNSGGKGGGLQRSHLGRIRHGLTFLFPKLKIPGAVQRYLVLSHSGETGRQKKRGYR